MLFYCTFIPVALFFVMVSPVIPRSLAVAEGQGGSSGEVVDG